MAGGGGLPVPAPIVAGDLLLLTSNHRPLVASHPQKPVFAVKRSATGTLPVPQPDEPGAQVAWCQARVGNYIQTPIAYRGLLYLCQESGVVHVLDVATGESYGRHRLGAGQVGFSASAVAGEGKLYFTSEEGDVHVVEAGKEFQTLGLNPLGEICMATPAIARGALLFRTRHHVVAVGGGDATAVEGK
jgi:outer membrane protein assembly factor BamB